MVCVSCVVDGWFTTTVCVVVALQFAPRLTVTSYVVVVVGLTLMLAVLPKPFVQVYEVPPEATNVAVSPTQSWLGPEMTAVGVACTFTVWLAVLEQLLPFVTVTVYVVVVVGETLTVALEPNPLLHWYEPPPLADKSTVKPLQIVLGPLMLATGNVFTVTSCVVVHPLRS